ncbi:MAG: methytransferase partner Trm112 [Dehalococcoidales bacterium]|nr:methytransferase partner Trm112 [Dehalococcoidales bacterium]
MKREIMSILVCPACKGKLELNIREENEREIVSGSLYCAYCKIAYPIEDTIPNLLPQEPAK